eukprot:CAMPEP_0194271656 /NCGR_PEP_ID=MMETSP0169-20130528/5387_1 /TAXON_ID=218684 /ORGANISM="Corethron pennatum, Strain L29A3" /LENGTH=131 /DNA_ID=CAMNT_0039014057 /DNA_START=158 /DNA_END=550 /DNA_ORIENTATION=+
MERNTACGGPPPAPRRRRIPLHCSYVAPLLLSLLSRAPTVAPFAFAPALPGAAIARPSPSRPRLAPLYLSDPDDGAGKKFSRPGPGAGPRPGGQFSRPGPGAGGEKKFSRPGPGAGGADAATAAAAAERRR